MNTFGQNNKRVFTAWQNRLNDFTRQEKLPGSILSVFREKQEPIAWTGATGNLSEKQPYFITGVGKLHILALLLKLKVRGLVDLDAPITRFLTGEPYRELSKIKGQDYTYKITVRHLLSHLSGLPDYFQFSFSGDKSLGEELLAGKDQSWTQGDWLVAVKRLGPQYAPGARKKIVYADSNFQLLGKIIEEITCQSLEDTLINFHFKPLGMHETYVYKDIHDRTPATFYHHELELEIPRAMCSLGPVGGMVSTCRDSMTFIKAFFHGNLFPLSELQLIQEWIPVKASLSYGLGISRYEKPRISVPWRDYPEIIGHTGLSGAFAFFVPDLGVFLTGTTNQSTDTLLPFKLARKFTDLLIKQST
ncbi:CubicO group peptidase, beta-lactamase class C family [Cyclobacterium lianum]|uniref:CubicO group peptidase, beta-lactamase class C family n=1 Tax=Cyclobacterium lianum TaxID=388280 RepID=A0A1M7PFC9_9BACT|nr:serine hydrolase domain-containing protein [Cyclobacterium lianum]SHN15455.1 CubicO group peptidase, beta-lactamase class C family [Cyclobacterium lianum]